MATVDERMLANTGGTRRSFLFLRAPPPPESLVLPTDDDLVEETDDDVTAFGTSTTNVGSQSNLPTPTTSKNNGIGPFVTIVDQNSSSGNIDIHRDVGKENLNAGLIDPTYGTIQRTNFIIRKPSKRRGATAETNEDSGISIASVFLAPTGRDDEVKDDKALGQMMATFDETHISTTSTTSTSNTATATTSTAIAIDIADSTTLNDTDITSFGPRRIHPIMDMVDSPISTGTPSLSTSPTTAGTTARTSIIAEFGLLDDTTYDNITGSADSSTVEGDASFRSPVWHRAVDHRFSVPQPRVSSQRTTPKGTLRNSMTTIDQSAHLTIQDQLQLHQADQSVYVTPGELTPRLSRHGSYNDKQEDILDEEEPALTLTTETTIISNESELDEGSSVRLSQLTLDQLMEERQKIAMEILDTERTYVERLTILLEQFRDPLAAKVGKPGQILTDAAIQEIFKHLEPILHFHRELLQRLESRINVPSWNPVQGCLGDIFIRLAPYLKIYTMYLGNCSHAMGRVSAHMGASPAFVRFLKEVDMKQRMPGITLQAYLLEPMQRVPRYCLLLERLMRKTGIGHPDHEQLKDALEEVEKVTKFANEMLRGHDEARRIIDIQRSLAGFSERLLVPGRKLLKRGSVRKICRKNHQRREFFLFSDILLYASPGIIEDSFVFHRKLLLEHCKVVSVTDNEMVQNAFQILSPDKSFQVYTESPQEKREWIDAISTAIQELQEAQGTLKKEKKARPQLDSFKHRVVDEYKAPVWVPDDDAVCCMICDLEFRLYRRKHHCRLCGKVVCHACSSRNFLIPGESAEQDRVERACDLCFHERWGNADVDDEEEEALADLWRSRTLNFVQSPGLAARIGRMNTISESPAAKCCGICRKDFTVFRWRNVCASCHKTVCGECLSKRAQVDAVNLAAANGNSLCSSDPSARICDPCYMGVDPSLIVLEENGNGWRFVAPSGSQENLRNEKSGALSNSITVQA